MTLRLPKLRRAYAGVASCGGHRLLPASLSALAEVSALFAAAGITWVQDAWAEHGQVDAWLAAATAGSLRFRANLAFRVEPTSWKDQLGELAADRDRVSGSHLGSRECRCIKGAWAWPLAARNCSCAGMASPATSLENMSNMEASRGSAPSSALLIRRILLRSLSDSRIRTASGKLSRGTI